MLQIQQLKFTNYEMYYYGGYSLPFSLTKSGRNDGGDLMAEVEDRIRLIVINYEF